MARGTPYASKGTVGSKTSGQRLALADLIIDLATAYKVSTLDTWVQVDEYDAASNRYTILHSQGSPLLGPDEAGDADLWVLIQVHTSGVYVRSMMDFCPSANTYRRLTSTSSANLSMDDTSAFDWWCVVNDYEFCFVFVQAGTIYGVWFGQPQNGISEDSAIGGRARLSAATSTTGTVDLSLDRDLTGKLTVGQKIYIVNQTPDGDGSLCGDYCEIVTVESVGSSTVQVSGVTNQPYKIGSLVGLYPFCCVSASPTTTFLYQIYSSILPSSADGSSLPGTALTFFNSSDENNMDPDFAGIYRMTRCYVNSYNSGGYYGISELILICPTGTQANGDRMLIEGNASKAYWIFPGLLSSGFGNGCSCIGPGATV